MSLVRQVKDIIQGKPKAKRSNRWNETRKDYLEQHGYCVVCGNKKKLEIHHKKPFHLFPEFELDVSNLITLCEMKKRGIVCHLLIGHLGNYKSFNPDVEQDAQIWHAKLSKAKYGLDKSS